MGPEDYQGNSSELYLCIILHQPLIVVNTAAGDLTLEGDKKTLPGPERQRCRLDIQVSGCGKTSEPSHGQRGKIPRNLRAFQIASSNVDEGDEWTGRTTR